VVHLKPRLHVEKSQSLKLDQSLYPPRWSQSLPALTDTLTRPEPRPGNRIAESGSSGLPIDTIPGEGIRTCSWFAMGEFSPTTRNGDCEEIANPLTAFGRRPNQIVDASCGNEHCIALRHAYLRPRVEQPGKYRKIADRVHRMKTGEHFEVKGVGIDERSRNRVRSGLYAAARLDKVSVRGLPNGSVRITKVGEWSSVRG
jgi:hypothetical protein